MQPLVSISCTTYNHAAFIRKCLDGFLMQETSFAFEIVIYDDASTDGTQEIIRQYARKYPTMFFPLLQNENQYSKGVRSMMYHFNFHRCRGKYIALCEGDDYWTDPLKLQKQITLLESQPEITMSMARVNMHYDENDLIVLKREFIHPEKQNIYTLRDYLKQPFSQTSSIVFRNNIPPMPAWMTDVTAGDQSLVVVILGKEGKLFFHDEVFSHYRINKQSITQSDITKVLANNFKMFRYWNEYFGYEYKHLIRSRIIENRILYYLFRIKWVRKVYKQDWVEHILQFVYKGIMWFKNLPEAFPKKRSF